MIPRIANKSRKQTSNLIEGNDVKWESQIRVRNWYLLLNLAFVGFDPIPRRLPTCMFYPKTRNNEKIPEKKQSRISSFDDPTTLLDTTLSSRKNEISFLPRVSGTRTTSKYLHTPSISVSNFSDFAPFQVQISSSIAMVASTARLVKYLPNSSFRMTQLKKRILKSFLSLKNTVFFFTVQWITVKRNQLTVPEAPSQVSLA